LGVIRSKSIGNCFCQGREGASLQGDQFLDDQVDKLDIRMSQELKLVRRKASIEPVDATVGRKEGCSLDITLTIIKESGGRER